jgi:hypothetical protein
VFDFFWDQRSFMDEKLKTYRRKSELSEFSSVFA